MKGHGCELNQFSHLDHYYTRPYTIPIIYSCERVDSEFTATKNCAYHIKISPNVTLSVYYPDPIKANQNTKPGPQIG